MIDGPIDPLVEKMLDWTSKRQEVISGNVANLDTPGYHAMDVSFEDELSSISLASTNSGHMTLSNGSGMKVYEVDAEPNENGNTVDLEHQMSQLTKNGVQYMTLMEFLSSDIKSIKYSISEGGKA